MNEVSRVLDALDAGDPNAAAQLLPLVYEELRPLARGRLANERPGQTLDATALVHEAYLRLVDSGRRDHWESRGHFFAAAAEAMRRILVETARRKSRRKHGGGLGRRDPETCRLAAPALPDPIDIFALHEALDRLEAKAPRKAELVKLRYFAGCALPEAAAFLGIALSTAEADWTYAKAWLRRELQRGEAAEG
jgi:RNA polymerase sigma factor (TIGR02999 family)